MRAAAVIIAAASLFSDSAAQASCAAPESTAPFDIRVTGNWKAQHVSDGDIRGCLLTAETADGKKITAYTSYEFICALKADEKISVAPSYACCDTGLQGDFVCGVTPRVPLAVVNQTPLMLAPAAHDPRAIMDLIAGSLSGNMREAAAIPTLQEYLADPAYAEIVRKELPRLEAALTDGTITNDYLRGQVMALLVAAYPDSPQRPMWRATQFSSGIDYALTPMQKSIAQEMLADPKTVDLFMPVLINRLRNASDDDRSFLLSVAARTPATKKYASAIYNHLGSLLRDPAGPDARPPPANETDRLRREEEKKQLARMSSETALRAKALMPLITKIACQGETGQVIIGDNEPTTIDCH